MSDERISQNKKQYFTVNFDQVTEAGLKDLIQSFMKAKAKVVEVVASNRKEKKDGQHQKRVQLIFSNGQSVRIAIGDQGDVIQTKLNNSIIPISSAATSDIYARDVVMAMEKNQPTFEKALARKAAAAIKDTSDVKPASRPLAARIEEVSAAIKAANDNLDVERKRLAKALDNVTASTNELESLKSTLTALKSEENQLVEAIKSGGGTV